jgi:RodZ C-terminal domain
MLFAVAAIGAAALTTFTVAAWRDYRDAAPKPRTVTTAPPTTSVAAAEFRQPSRVRPPATPATRLVLTATRGESWIEVRAGSETGVSLYEGTLARGDRLSYAHNRLWLRFGLPENVDARIDGEPAELPPGVLTMLLHGGRLTAAEPG